MIRYAGVLALVALFAIVAGQAAAADPPGPRLSFVLSDFAGHSDLVTVGPSGGNKQMAALAATAAGAPYPIPSAPPAWSPDGLAVAYTELVGWERRDYDSSPLTRIVLSRADGTLSSPLPGSAEGDFAVFAPDGRTIAFAKLRDRFRNEKRGGGEVRTYFSYSVWLADVSGGVPRQITPWRNGLRQVPSSFSPDGEVLAITRSAGGKAPEAIGLRLDGSASGLRLRNAVEPVFSPDGGRLAFVRPEIRKRRSRDGDVTGATVTDLISVDAGGGDRRRLTDTLFTSERAPQWDPSGWRLSFLASQPFGPEAETRGYYDVLTQVNADGSCRTSILRDGEAEISGASWQPGPGRGAGPILCR